MWLFGNSGGMPQMREWESCFLRKRYPQIGDTPPNPKEPEKLTHFKRGYPMISEKDEKPGSTGFCGFRRNEAKLAKNDQGFSQYASKRVYQNKRESEQIFKANYFAY